MDGPLAGVRVIDLSHVLNGPFCTMLLAHMGADVLKIEHGKGDRYRHSWMPVDAGRDGYEFLAINANKRCITLNLKHPDGRRLFEELVRRSDVLVENFSRGVMDRLGFGYESLRGLNERLVYASARGYGETGPNADVRAFAPTVLAASGWVDKAWSLSGRPGTRVLGIGDEASGVSLALGVCAALYAREQTGRGQRIDVSMQEALLGFMVSTLHTHFEGQPVGRDYKPCKDGHVSFHLPDMSDELWQRFATALGHPEAIDDPRFATARSRREHFDDLEQAVLEWVRDRRRDELAEIFREHRLPSAPVLPIADVIEDPHVKARGAFVEVEHPEAGVLQLLRPWISFSETPTRIRHAGPAVGEHNEEVFAELLGISNDELEALRREGAI